MTRLPVAATRFERLQRQVLASLFGAFRGPWRRRSLGLLALLVGFYAGSNLTSYWLARLGQRPPLVLAMVVLLELVVRLRTRMVKQEPGLGWLMADNLRIGLVYAVVLEAFKLGS